MTKARASRCVALHGPRACVLGIGITLMLCAVLVQAEDLPPKDGKPVQFNSAFLPGGSAMKIDLSRYARRNPVMPGTYEADVWLNGEWQVRRSVHFAADDTQSDAVPCLSGVTLTSLGVALAAGAAADDLCLPVSDHAPGATARFDVSEQRLDIEVPQAALIRHRFGMVPPGKSDDGIPSGQLAWRLNLHRSTSGRRSRTVRLLAHEAGINAGHWRVRGAGSWSASRYARHHLYVERQVDAWRAQWRLGEVMVADGTFAPVRLRGMTIASDARMEDDANLGYKPTVRGVARTHARVRVSQAAVLLRELAVPPGLFVIDDLQGLGRGGDLYVTIDEEDGGRTSFRVPFFAMPELLGEGQSTVAMSAGHTVATRGQGSDLMQATWRRGFARDTTIYTGLRRQGSGNSALIGAAIDTLAGAFAVDFTGARMATRSHFGSSGRGRTWRVRHGRRWHDGTSMWLNLVRERGSVAQAVGGRRHSSEGRNAGHERLDVVFHRELPADNGILTASASQRRSLRPVPSRHSGSERSYALAWTRGWQRATLDVSMRHDTDDTSARVGISMPLGSPSSPTLLTVTGHESRTNGGRLQVGVGGAIGSERELGYGAFVENGADRARRLGLSASHLSGAGESSLAIDRAGAAHGESFSTAGALVFHRHGITRAQRLGEAMALVHAPGAAGARLPSATGVRLDRRGYGVVPYLAAFRWNAVEIDPTGMSLDVSLSSTRRRVAPTAGALVLVPFETDVGRTSLLVARLADGSPPAFGADVLDGQGRSVGVVGQAGNIFVRDVEPGAPLTVRWGDRSTDRCVVRAVRGGEAAQGLARLTGVCE
ncbi:fimbria/pilus outer membrane usher protein [Luteibacter sp. OK325]|uniref:fimbria/pilus outer membrane usher protein n=1 Tax=Luteibacter sp. OK325 TaxID=2135670 RepID=UPI000D3738A3